MAIIPKSPSSRAIRNKLLLFGIKLGYSAGFYSCFKPIKQIFISGINQSVFTTLYCSVSAG
jgi:hypothetical protein